MPTNHSTIGRAGSELLILLFSQAPLVLLFPPRVFHLLAAISPVRRRLVLWGSGYTFVTKQGHARQAGAQILDWRSNEKFIFALTQNEPTLHS